MKYGYIIVRNAFTAEQAADFTKDLWVRLGMDPNDPATWTQEKVHMPRQQEVITKEFMPKVSVYLIVEAFAGINFNVALAIRHGKPSVTSLVATTRLKTLQDLRVTVSSSIWVKKSTEI
jgi:hypothetical protein